MSDRPPFDPVRASFLLVAAVIAVHCAIALAGAGVCAWRLLSDATATNVTAEVFGANGTDWDEASITFNNAPTISGSAISRPGADANVWGC